MTVKHREKLKGLLKARLSCLESLKLGVEYEQGMKGVHTGDLGTNLSNLLQV